MTTIDYEQVLLLIGQAAGALTRPEIRDRLAVGLRDGHLKAGYITLLRDQLSAVLRQTGLEQPISDGRLVEIRDELLPAQGERLDCIAYARAVLREAGVEAARRA